jgi:AcrR family transcriptional regulator
MRAPSERPGRYPAAATATAAQSARQDAASWITAALEILANEGVDGVRIERVARRLGVTKGSFYWHFKDRAALHLAMLEHWRRQVTLDLFDRAAEAAPPLDRYQALMRASPTSGGCSQEALDVELSIRLWARRDERARAALQEVDDLRIRYIARLLTECGVPPEQSAARAMLAYAYLRTAASFSDEAAKAQGEAFLLQP